MGQNPTPEEPGARPTYLDCAATTPLDPRVRSVILHHLDEEFGNAGSRTHEYGNRARKAVQAARNHVAAAVALGEVDVAFTSGATESNNLAILGLAPYAEAEGRLHIVSSEIEHKAVLEPLAELERRGFSVTRVRPTAGGWVDPDAVAAALRPDTVLVSIMLVNNETGVVQPIREIGELLADHPAFFHTDAAQGFGKSTDALRSARVDTISISGHKIYGPKGVGALVLRKRVHRRPPLRALSWGGGQERGLRPGTLAVPLIAGLGEAARLAQREELERREKCLAFRERLLAKLAPLTPRVNGDVERTIPQTVNLSFPGLDSEAVMVALRDLVAISNGSACTSQTYERSHVLQSMGMSEERTSEALRWSWFHGTEEPDWDAIVKRVRALR